MQAEKTYHAKREDIFLSIEDILCELRRHTTQAEKIYWTNREYILCGQRRHTMQAEKTYYASREVIQCEH